MGYRDRSASGWAEVSALAESQHGVVSRAQLRSLGFSDRVITGDGAVLSHGSAAELLGLWDREPLLISVTAPGAEGREIAGVRPHFTLPPTPEEVGVVDRIPCTTVSRTIVDMAGKLGARSLGALIEEAAVLRSLDPGEIDRILARGRRRGAPMLRRALIPWRRIGRPRLRSRMEARILPMIAATELPLPACNVRLVLEERTIEADLIWEEERLIVELDGGRNHDHSGAFRRDRWRDQVLVAAGYRATRVTWDQLVDEPAAVIDRIRRALDH